MDAQPEGWAYANNWRIAAVFLGLAIVFLGIGVLAVSSFGENAGIAGVSLLAIASFILVFTVLVFVPRLAKRGSVSFSLISSRSLAEAERAVVEAIEAEGKQSRVDVVRSRSDHPPRVVTAEGIKTRFRIERSRIGPGMPNDDGWTEIVQSVGLLDEDAARLRARIAERLAARTATE